jgi:hypothetical protein
MKKLLDAISLFSRVPGYRTAAAVRLHPRKGNFEWLVKGWLRNLEKATRSIRAQGTKQGSMCSIIAFIFLLWTLTFDYLVPECFIEVLVVHFRRSFSLTRLGNSNDLGIELLFFFHRISPSISELNCLVGVLSARKRRILAIEYSMRSATVAALCNCFPASSLCFLFKGFHCT